MMRRGCVGAFGRPVAPAHIAGSGGIARPSAWPAVSVLALAAAAYFAIGLLVVPRVPGEWSVYAVQPAIWLAVTAAAVVVWRRGAAAPHPPGSLVPLAVLVGAFQVALWAVLGLINGFGDSPYSHSGWALLGNGLFVVAPLLGLEFTRACVIGSFGRRYPTLIVMATGVIFGALAVPLLSYTSIEDTAGLFRFSGEFFLPAIAMSVLASVLVHAAGPVASLSYLGVVAAFEWLSPLLPATEWIALAFVGMMGPIIGLVVVRGHLYPEEAAAAPAPSGGWAWRTASVFVVTFVFFSNGLLGLQPLPVVGTSMVPSFETGDLVITRNVDPEDVAVGDVIRYRAGNDFVLHRVVAIWDGGIERQFMTRGDANDADDPPVSSFLLEGKVILKVPKIGWAPIKLRQWLAEVIS